ncbi:MAG: helix-turn-helix domain-containing protein [Enterocloster clostridioformis]
MNISRSITPSPPLRWRLSLKISSSAGSISPELSRNTLWKAFTDISTICECSSFRRDIAAGHSVLDACTNSGFASYNSFLKSFRNLYGMTPTQYRAQLNSIEKRSLNTYNS